MQLFLYEEIMLLALRDDTGTLLADYIEYSVAGAVAAELLLLDKIKVNDDKHKTIQVLNNHKLGDPIIDECLDLLDKPSKTLRLQDVVSKFANLKELRHKVARQLCRRGIVKEDEQKILFIFTKKTYPEINPQPERDIINKMEAVMFHQNNDIEPRTLVLIALADSAKLLTKNFDKDRLKTHEDRIKRLVKGEIAGTVSKEVVAACETAVLITVIMPAMMSTVITSTIIVNS
jgi:hypothetical protein